VLQTNLATEVKQAQKLWPTPNAMDGMAPRSEDALREAQTKGGCSNLKDVTAHPSLYPTSETWTAETSTELISSQGDFLASLSATPGSAGARKMTVTSGLKCSALLRKHDPLGSLVKTLLASSRWNSTVVFLTWKVSATPSGRCLYQLAPWEPSTDECESGLLPTINSREGGSPFDGGSNASYRKEGQTSKDMVQMWRTPNTNSLPDAIEHKMLPTPTEDDSSNVYPKDNRYGSLVATVNKETGNTPVRAVGSLNPQFVSWLMGYPLDWCDMPEESQQASPTESPSSAD
jgi:hypothetical protein